MRKRRDLSSFTSVHQSGDAMRNQSSLSFSNYFSPAEHAFSGFMFRNPRTLISGGNKYEERSCPECDDTAEEPSSLGAAITDWMSAAQTGQPKLRAVAAKNVFNVARASGRAPTLSAATAIPQEGVRPEDAIIINTILKEIAKDLPDDCKEEWEWALEHCRKELAKPYPNRRFTGGHKDVKSCAKGFVSDRCGGNSLRIEHR
jgi:hypothetical protein